MEVIGLALPPDPESLYSRASRTGKIKEEFIDICTDNLREKEWIYLFIPDLELMIFGAPGLQNIVIFQSDRGKDILKECVEKQGLFLVAGCGS